MSSTHIADRAVELASGIASIRDVMRRHYGERYAAEIEPFRRIIRERAAEWECPVLSVPPRLVRLMESDVGPVGPLTVGMLVAAAAEECGDRANALK